MQALHGLTHLQHNGTDQSSSQDKDSLLVAPESEHPSNMTRVTQTGAAAVCFSQTTVSYMLHNHSCLVREPVQLPLLLSLTCTALLNSCSAVLVLPCCDASWPISVSVAAILGCSGPNASSNKARASW